MSGIRPQDCSKLGKNPKNNNDVTIFRHDVNVKFFWRYFVSLVKFNYWSKFQYHHWFWQFSFIRDRPEIRKSEILPSEFCPKSGDWDESWIRNLAWMSLIQCYWMLQNTRVTSFTVWVIKGKPTNQQTPPPPNQIRVNYFALLTMSFFQLHGMPLFIYNGHNTSTTLHTYFPTCYCLLSLSIK